LGHSLIIAYNSREAVGGGVENGHLQIIMWGKGYSGWAGLFRGPKLLRGEKIKVGGRGAAYRGEEM